MRIARVSSQGRIFFGVIDDEEIVHEMAGPPIGDIQLSDRQVPLADCRLLAPVLPSKIVAVGRNYQDHASEMGGEVPPEPLLFLKPSTAVIGPGEPIKKPSGVSRLDHEAELAVVVSGLVRRVDEDQAARAILGYTCGNDVSARDYQASDGQWTRAKGFDSFCPLGPWIETDLGDGLDLTIQSRLNDETRQDGNTKDLVFSPTFLVAYVSHIMTLLPGDVILTGTPAGVGPMEPGDVVEVDIEGIGVLRNRVEAGF